MNFGYTALFKQNYLLIITMGYEYVIGFKLGLSAERGDMETVKKFVKYGADTTFRDSFAARMAAANGHIEILKYLIENGADINPKTIDDFEGRLYNNPEIDQYIAQELTKVITIRRNIG